ncbi:MAG: hypothetical protein JO071_15240 [Deltaproteobacteria bacterium]|nr:hypothetical protein [Deltaproteobacteria bacterium]
MNNSSPVSSNETDHRHAPQPPLAQKARAFSFDGFAAIGVDQALVILGHFLAQVGQRRESASALGAFAVQAIPA